MIDVEWHDYGTAEEMAVAVAERIGDVIEQAIDARGEALLALPGGRSPALTFKRLADLPLDWSRVTIIPTDDRVVPATSHLSNYVKIAGHFLPKGATVIPIVVGDTDDYRTAGLLANAQLADLRWPPDLVWLGVGTDGHIASIFPGPDLTEALDCPPARRALGLMPCPLPAEAPVARVTLSRPAILSARRVLVTASGAQKRAVMELALRDGPHSVSPIGQVLADAKAPIDIRWSET